MRQQTGGRGADVGATDTKIIRKPPSTPISKTFERIRNASLPEVTGLFRERLAGMLKRMILIREFEDQCAAFYRSGMIRGVTHTYQGQEAVAVGASWNLTDTDYITSTHRGHAHVLAKGGDERLCMAELMGRRDGYCRGRGGSMHIADFSKGILGANGIVGGGTGIAVGSALASQMLGNGRITICFFGDGALNEGILHEVSNLAAIWKLPCIFVCENNLYGMSGAVDQMLSLGAGSFLSRPEAYGIPGVECDGMDVIDVFMAVRQAAERARHGEGPSYVICHTYRFLGHHVGDPLSYRDREEAELWRTLDPIPAFGGLLQAQGLAGAEDLERWTAEARHAIEAAVAFAKASPEPDCADLMEGLFG
jgi:acetoin:2,6-dichlorophenolindophenol oxidoreductase subunit alpha